MIIVGLDKDSLPTKPGIYSAKGIWDNWEEAQEIDVYLAPKKGLSCFSKDFGSAGTEVDKKYDCHVSVQFTGLEFISRVGDLK